MVAKLTVIFFIILCLLAGFVLTIFPWISVGRIGDWGDNYFLVSLSNVLHTPALQNAISSGWVRGAVSGLGILNLFIAFWEIANFKQSVESVEENSRKTVK
jgi:hypothetical protein